MVYGQSGAGKSFFVLDLVATVARGVEWRERKVRQANVLYVCAEGAGGFRSRGKAYSQHHNADLSSALYMVPAAPNFLRKDDPSEIIAEAERVGAELIVIDTLAQVTPGVDENSSEIGKALAQCRRVHEATGAMVCLVHHAGKDLGKGARGWSGIRAAVDMEIEVADAGNEVRVARITKMKDGREGEEFAFKLTPVCVGFDADDDEIESCVVEAADARLVRRKAPTGQAGSVWAAYHDLVRQAGDAVDREALIAAAISAMPVPNPDSTDRRRDSVVRALKKLVADGLLVEEAGQVRSASDSTAPL